jgi:cbb3-type cytochrome oxidase subunit 3
MQTMDINTLRIVATILAFSAFVSIVAWAFLPSRREAQEERGRSVLDDEAGERGA